MTGPIESHKRSLVYGRNTIAYRLLYSKRKTMEIAVHPDGTVVVKAPLNADISLIEKKISKRARWIFKQLKYFQQFIPNTPERCYVNGETHLYLGRQYRLKMVQGNENGVKLTRGFFLITCRDRPTPQIAKNLLGKWYIAKATQQFHDSLNRCRPRFKGFSFDGPEISLKKMRKRWGSLSDKGAVTLNPELVKAPKECIDYVMTHELCHLKYHDHGSEFYNLLESLMPDWKKIKHRLELTMA